VKKGMSEILYRLLANPEGLSADMGRLHI